MSGENLKLLHNQDDVRNEVRSALRRSFNDMAADAEKRVQEVYSQYLHCNFLSSTIVARLLWNAWMLENEQEPTDIGWDSNGRNRNLWYCIASRTLGMIEGFATDHKREVALAKSAARRDALLEVRAELAQRIEDDRKSKEPVAAIEALLYFLCFIDSKLAEVK